MDSNANFLAIRILSSSLAIKTFVILQCNRYFFLNLPESQPEKTYNYADDERNQSQKTIISTFLPPHFTLGQNWTATRQMSSKQAVTSGGTEKTCPAVG